MFSDVSVILSSGGGVGPNVTLDLTAQGPLDTALLVVTSGGQNYRPVQTCSLEDSLGAAIWWLLKHVCASYWNTFLFIIN